MYHIFPGQLCGPSFSQANPKECPGLVGETRQAGAFQDERRPIRARRPEKRPRNLGLWCLNIGIGPPCSQKEQVSKLETLGATERSSIQKAPVIFQPPLPGNARYCTPVFLNKSEPPLHVLQPSIQRGSLYSGRFSCLDCSTQGFGKMVLNNQPPGPSLLKGLSCLTLNQAPFPGSDRLLGDEIIHWPMQQSPLRWDWWFPVSRQYGQHRGLVGWFQS